MQPLMKFRDTQYFLLKTAQIGLVSTAFFVPISITATNILMTITAALGLLSGKFTQQFKHVKANPLTLAILLILAIILLGVSWSIAPWNERMSSLHKYAKLLYIPFLMPLCLDKRWRTHTIDAFLVAMVITVLISYIKALISLHGTHLSTPKDWVFHPHIETSYFVAFATYIFADRAFKKSPYAWMYGLLIAIFTFQEFFINQGRTGWIIYFALTLLFLIQHTEPAILSNNTLTFAKRLKLGLRGFLYGLVLILLLALPTYLFSSSFHKTINQWSQLTNPTVINKCKIAQSSLSYQTVNASDCFRATFIQFSLKLLQEHPLLGLGTGSFPQAYRQSGGIIGWSGDLNNPHNEYLLMLTQCGIIGWGILLYLFYSQWKISFSLNDERHIAQAFILAFMVGCAFNSFLYTSVTGHFYVLFTSVLFANYSRTESKS